MIIGKYVKHVVVNRLSILSRIIPISIGFMTVEKDSKPTFKRTFSQTCSFNQYDLYRIDKKKIML